MNLNTLKGKGLDVSRSFYLNKLKSVKHGFMEPNNFYTLKKFANYESLDYIFSKNIINDTKFFKVLLKEWFYFIKVNGILIIEMQSNTILDFENLEKISLILFQDKCRILEKEKIGDGYRIIIKKTRPALAIGDSIDKWTFGIITNGSKEEELENQISSIIDLKIPEFEIIICGPYNPKNKYSKFVKVIPFEPKVAWITKKKNLICKAAKYENLVITHNRFNFDKNWYNGMKKYNNYFEILTCKIISPSGRRAGDWVTNGQTIANRWYNKTGLLEYKDWDENVNINGSFYILKKSTWKKCPWDESLIYGQNEDDKLSLDFHKNGIVPRFNPYSTVHTFPERYGNWFWTYTYNNKKLGRIPFEFSIRYFQKKLNYLIRKYSKFGIVVKQDYETYGWK